MTQSPVEFSIGPGGSTLKLPANGGTNTLNLSTKFKNSYQLLCLKHEKLKREASQDQEEGGRLKKKKSLHSSSGGLRAEKYTHLLIAKVKDTQIMFSFILEASVVEGQAANMS